MIHLRKLILIGLMLVLPLVVWGQESLAFPIIQSPSPFVSPPYDTTVIDTNTQGTAQFVDYLFVDTTASRLRPYFGGAPFTFCWIADSISGLPTDSCSISYAFLVLYDAVEDTFYTESYDESGNSRETSIWDNYDWTTDRRYNYKVEVNYPCWGVRFKITCTQTGATSAQSHNIYTWGIRQ